MKKPQSHLKRLILVASFAMFMPFKTPAQEQSFELPEATVHCRIYSGSYCFGGNIGSGPISFSMGLCLNWKRSVCDNPDANQFWWA